jgi:hypothetical protein
MTNGKRDAGRALAVLIHVSAGRPPVAVQQFLDVTSLLEETGFEPSSPVANSLAKSNVRL